MKSLAPNIPYDDRDIEIDGYLTNSTNDDLDENIPKKLRIISYACPCADYLVKYFFPRLIKKRIKIRVNITTQLLLLEGKSPNELPVSIVQYLKSNPEELNALIKELKSLGYDSDEMFIDHFWKILDVYAGFEHRLTVYEKHNPKNKEINPNYLEEADEDTYSQINEDCFGNLIEEYRNKFNVTGYKQTIRAVDLDRLLYLRVDNNELPLKFKKIRNKLIFNGKIVEVDRVAEIFWRFLNQYVKVSENDDSVVIKNIRGSNATFNPADALLTPEIENNLFDKIIEHYKSEYSKAGNKVHLTKRELKRIRRFNIDKTLLPSNVIFNGSYVSIGNKIFEKVKVGMRLLYLLRDYVNIPNVEN